MKHNVFVVAVLLLASILRLSALGSVPNGLYQDETAIGYNAYSILETGKDEYGRSFPLYFQSFGDYKLPVYVYATVPMIKMFGLTPFAVRLPSALAGILCIGALYLVVRLLTNDKKHALAAGLLLAINPWHLHYSRATFEVSVSLMLFLFGIASLFYWFKKRIKGFFLLGTLLFIIGFYSYNLTRLLAPLIYLSVLIFLNKQHNFTRRNLFTNETIFSYIIGFILLVPFISSFFSSGGVHSAAGTLLYSSAYVQAPLLEFRSYFLSLPEYLSKMLFNSVLLTVITYIKNIVSYLSVDFFFLTGSRHGNHGIGTHGQFYLAELYTILLGITQLYKTNKKWLTFLTYWIVLVVIVSAVTREAPHATRSFFLVFPLVTFSSYGIYSMIKRIAVQVQKKHFFLRSSVRPAFEVFVIVLLFISIAHYFLSYFIRFPVAYAKQWSSRDSEVVSYVMQNEQQYSTVIFDKNTGFQYTSFLFYSQYNPVIYQKTAQYAAADSEGFTPLKRLGKYQFGVYDNNESSNEKPILLITTQESVPDNATVIKTIQYPKRPVYIALGQEMSSFVVEDTAYVIVSIP